MSKLLLTILIVTYSSVAFSQHNYLFFKKGNKTIDRFWVGRFIAFQLKDHEWRKGGITRISNDSFYIKPVIAQYTMSGIDTISFPVEGYSISDVRAMPRKGYLIEYKNGGYRIIKSAGHVHFYWVKSGWLFRTGAIGHAALNTANSAIKNEYSKTKGRLAVSGGVFLFGVLLKKLYNPTLRLKNKYHFKVSTISMPKEQAPPLKNF